MPSTPPITFAGRDQRILPGGDGYIFELGDASAYNASMWVIQFVPDLTFSGMLVIMGRVRGRGPDADAVPFVPIPYRRTDLANVASDASLVTAPITDACLIRVPSDGLSVGFLVNCTAGSGKVYSHPFEQPAVA